MPEPQTTIYATLSKPGSLALSGNLAYATESGARQVSAERQPSGHHVYYREDGRRILLTDPDGHPLHECEWSIPQETPGRLISARLYLDWGEWVGLKPNGLVNSIMLDLSSRPGWQQITRQHLRVMASQIMKVQLDEVEFFYGDDDLTIDPTGRATIRQRKDAFYVLRDGRFEHAEFMSCMSAMHWDRIDYLPVVELFKSLLPGTGSAAFELIRGLYDDQNPHVPTPLRYRGIPTYPSEGAFGLFSNFFTPTHSGGEPVFEVFMNPPRSHEIEWYPRADQPFRFVHSDPPFCLTVRKGVAQKITVVEDSSGLPFVSPKLNGFAAFGKSLEVKGPTLFLHDQNLRQEIPIDPQWGVTRQDSSRDVPPVSESWRQLFPAGPPQVTPREAFSAVLLYPEDDSEIGEWSSQPFVADYLEDVIEQDEHLAARKASCTRLLVHGFDATIGTCLAMERQCPHTIVYSHAAYAQKHAQLLWNQLARKKETAQLGNYRFVMTDEKDPGLVYQEGYDLIYKWVPYSCYSHPDQLTESLVLLSQGLRRGGVAFVAGPESLSRCLRGLPLQILFGETVSGLEPFRMHRSILPKARLNPELCVWGLSKLKDGPN